MIIIQMHIYMLYVSISDYIWDTAEHSDLEAGMRELSFSHSLAMGLTM